MKKLTALVLASGFGFGCGESVFHVQLASENLSKAPGGTSRLEMQGGTSLAVQMVAVAAPGPVTFTADGLPAFTQQRGSLLMLSPARADAGEYSFSVTATSGGMSSTMPVDLVVTRVNNAPRWQFVVPETNFSDDKGARGPGACPGAATCTAYGAPLVEVGGRVVDDDGDVLHADVEVVPHGQPFTGTPTFASPVDANGNVSFTVNGLAAGTTYDFAVRVADAFGAIASTSSYPDGWVKLPQWGFEQGPCTGSQCACLPAGATMCVVGADCCSGICTPGAGPSDWGRCQ